jgi:hypothetical protein
MSFASRSDRPLTILMADVVFRVPIAREIGLWFGCLNASNKAVADAMSRSRNIMVLPGGVREIKHTVCGSNVMTVVKRRGFVRTALLEAQKLRPFQPSDQTISSIVLVPVVGFGVDDIHDQIILKNEFVRKLIGVYLFASTGKVGPWYPKDANICHVSGHPIPVPSMDSFNDQDIAALCDRFYDEFDLAFQKHKNECPLHSNVTVEYLNGWD